tara:strand:- start:1896 stop:2201 length:306 start_codon:yes stop_codon:yes gene_type:complete
MAGLLPDNKEEFDALLKAQDEAEIKFFKDFNKEQSQKEINNFFKDLEECYNTKPKKKVELVIEDVTSTLFNKEELQERYKISKEDLDNIEFIKNNNLWTQT